MLDLFRRLSKSKAGGFIFAIFIAALALGFVLADAQNLGFGGVSADTVAEVGDTTLSSAELKDRVQRAYETARRDRPELTIQQFVRQGGVDQVLAQLTDSYALEAFAKAQGIGVSRKMEDAVIASAPAFRGLNGQFDQSQFEQFLATQRVSEKQVRADLARDLYISQLLTPATGGGFAPATLTLPYASMLLEQRSGRAQFVPAAAFRGAAPTDAQLADFYKRNQSRYVVPERRVIRYALLNRAAFEAAATPTEAEIAKAYADGKAGYAGRETRTISQVILPDEAAARQVAARIAGGTPIADAARAAGLESVTLNDQSREDYARAAAPAVAAAVFATAQGQIAPPTRSGLGWHVVRVDAIKTSATRTLEQVRPELVERLRRDKATTAFAETVAMIEDAVGDGATFDEAVATNKLQAQTTPPVFASGAVPDVAGAVAPELAALAKAGFGMEAADDPVVEQIVPEQVAALVKTEQVLAAAPKPLAQIREQVAADFVADRGLAEARRVASEIVAKVNGGATLAQAAGAGLPAPTPVSGRRGELLQQGRTTTPQLQALFTAAPGKARAVAAPDKSGWYVVQPETVVPGDARGVPQLVASTQAQFAPVLGREYGEQLVRAAKAAIGVQVNTAALARVKSELVGTPAAQ